MVTTALDLRTTPPRSGRDMLGGFAWLARLADKVRAERAGTNGEYSGYCPLSMAFLNETGIPRGAFDALIDRAASDEEIASYFRRHVSEERQKAANRAVLEDHRDNLDQQDAEEGRA